MPPPLSPGRYVNIARHGGDPRKVFLGGHSAGGYLALLVGFDESRLRPYGFGLKDVAGIAQVSGQVFNPLHRPRGTGAVALRDDRRRGRPGSSSCARRFRRC